MIASLIVTGILFFLPFIQLPFGVTHFETPKVILFELSTLVLFLFVQFHSSFRFIFTRYVGLLAALILLIIFGIVVHPSSVTLFGNSYRMQGSLLMGILIFFSYISGQTGFWRPHQLIMLFLIFLELWLTLSGQFTPDGRGVGTIGEPNALSGVVLFLWPFVLLQNQPGEEKKRLQKVFSIFLVSLTTVLTCLILFLTGSRSGIIGLGLQIMFLILLIIFRLSLSRATLVCVILFLCSLALPFIQGTTKSNEYENRADIWKAAFIAGYEHPVTGWGFGNIEIAMHQEDHKLHNRVEGYYVDSSHNIFLDWWVQGGFVGISIFILLLYSTLRKFIQKGMNVGVLLLFGVLVSLSFNPGSVMQLIFLWFLIGQALFSGDQDTGIV